MTFEDYADQMLAEAENHVRGTDGTWRYDDGTDPEDEWGDAYGDYPSNDERAADMRADGLDVDGWTLAEN